MVKTCLNCGTKNPDEAFWCINCNTKLVGNPSIAQKESRSAENIELDQDVKLRDYILSLNQKESRIGMGLSIFKIPLIILFIVAIIWASVLFYSNIHIDEFNWEAYNFPWDNENLPWDNSNFPWIANLTLNSITDYSTASQEFVDTGEFGGDYWFNGNTIITEDGWIFTLSDVVDCDFEAITLDIHVYNKGEDFYYPTELFSPIDIFFGYDDVVDNPNNYPYKILHQFYRGVYFQCGGTADQQQYFRTHTSNTHLIPHTAQVLNTLKEVDIKDVVSLSGSYVNVYGRHPDESTYYTWTTDTVIGNSHCEIILVDTISIN